VTVHSHAVRRGATGVTFLVFARDPATGEGRAGLTADAGSSAAFVRAGEAAATPFRLFTADGGQVPTGGLAEVDPELLPGVYEVGMPDEVFAEGARRAMVLLRLPGAAVDPIHVELVGFDAQDSFRLGMASLSHETRVKTLRNAFPLVARREVELEEAEAAGRTPAAGPDATGSG
jgi:hypothetical protein